MKLVLNKCFGGPSLSQAAIEMLNKEHAYDFTPQDAEVIKLIEKRGSDFCSGSYAKLRVVEIPDGATDWEINEYDGIESLTYVLGGKLHHA